MAEQPENLVLELLRGMRGDMSGMAKDLGKLKDDMRVIKKTLDDHTLRFDFLEERVEMLREGTLTSIGFAANTSVQQKKLEQQVKELAKRVDKLEKSR